MLFSDAKTLAGKIHIGRFQVRTNEDYAGQLNIVNPKRPLLTLLHNNQARWIKFSDPPTIITGELTCGTKVTLLGCKKQANSTNLSFDYVISGWQHLHENDKNIVEIQFTVDDTKSLRWDPVFPGASEDTSDTETGSVEWNWMPEIFQADTALGHISARYAWDISSMQLFPPFPPDLHIQGDIIISLTFLSECSLEFAFGAARKVIYFLAMISGYPVAMVQAAIFPKSMPTWKFEVLPVPYYLPVYDSVSRESDTEPIVKDGEAMAQLLTQWIALGEGVQESENSIASRWEARKRYHTSCLLKGHVFDEDRLVAAANLYDLLPSSAVQSDFHVADDFCSAIKAARCIFKKLPKKDDIHHTRSRGLADLARLRKPTLKNKIQARAKIFTDQTTPDFDQIRLITDKAVQLRNQFVHGPDSSEEVPLGLLVVCTITLEFVFVVSELMEAGWEIQDLRQWPRVQHFIRRYPYYYDEFFNKFNDTVNS